MSAENPAAVKAADLNKVRLSSGESERRSATMKAANAAAPVHSPAMVTGADQPLLPPSMTP